MADSTQKEGLPECPRCGYDLSGQVLAWQTTCPLEGVCSECGLGLEFRLIFNPRLTKQRQYFEDAENQRARALLTTAFCCLRPRSFWRWVRMESEVNPGRVMVGAGVSGLLWFVVAGVIGWVVMFTLGVFQGTWRMEPEHLWELLVASVSPWNEWDSYGPRLFGTRGLGKAFVFTVVAALLAALMPAAFLLLPDTLKRAKVRRVHLVRIAGWSWVPLPLLSQVWMWAPQALFEADNLLFASRWPPYSEGLISWDLMSWLGEVRGPTLLCVFAVWLVAFWGVACGRYLKLPRPFVISLVMCVVAGLVAVLVALVLPGFSYFIAV